MITLIDCDGVLANFHKMSLSIIKGQFGIDVKSDGQNWDYFDYPDIKPISGKVWDYICSTPGLIRNLEKYEYTDRLISKLRDISDVICVTSIPRSRFYPSERFSWLIEELGFDRKDIILCHKKYLVNGDILIDDKPSNVVSWAKAWPNGLPILWESPDWFIDSREIEPTNIFKTGNVESLISYIQESTEK